jgi:elongator complex protein 3
MKQEWGEIIIKTFLQHKKLTEKHLQNINRKVCGAFGHAMISNTDLKASYRKLVENGDIEPNPDLERMLLVRKIRTQSGIAAIAVLTKPYPCPGTCAYCPSQKEMPKSYLSNEPAVMRAIA